VFLAPVNRAVSLLAAWIRLTYAAVAMVSLVPLTDILSLVTSTAPLDPAQMKIQVSLALISHYNAKTVGLVVFGIHLMVSGALATKATYIPKFFGLCLVVAGLGYTIHSLRPFFFPGYDVGFLMITFFGELFFGLWLLIKGTRIDEAKVLECRP
jgi:Domain of unknown function (DUF4386)